MTEPSILFEDPNVIVLNKPAGLLSQGGPDNEPNVVDWLRQYLDRHYVGLIHRLDRNTSGILLVAKRTKAAQRLTQALQMGKIFRSYLAVLKGRFEGQTTWKDRLLKDEKNNISRVVEDHPEAKIAETQIRSLQHTIYQGTELTLAELVLQTGRSHQIRAQCAHHGFPLVGDVKYDPKNRVKIFSRPALHSYRLEFPHPIQKDIRMFNCELPEDIKSLLEMK